MNKKQIEIWSPWILLVVVGAMAMVMYELFSALEKHTTGWAHRGTQGE